MAIFGAPGGAAYILKSGDTATHHQPAYGDPATSLVQSTLSSTAILLGVFDIKGGSLPTGYSAFQGPQFTVGDGVKLVTVDFGRERNGRWYTNDTTNPVVQLFTTAFGMANETASVLGTGRPTLGIVLSLDTLKGVFVAYPNE